MRLVFALLLAFRLAHAYSPTVAEEIVLAPGQAYPHALARAGDFLFVCLLTTPAQLVRLNAGRLADPATTLTFPADHHHDECSQLRYHAADAQLYASFVDGLRVTVTRIDPVVFSYDPTNDVIEDASTALNYGSIALSDGFLYAVTYQANSIVLRYRLPDFAKVDQVSLTGFGDGHAIEVDPTTETVFATGAGQANTPWIARLTYDPNGALLESQVVPIPSAFNHPTDDMALDGTFVYVGFENTANIGVFLRADLTRVLPVPLPSLPVWGTFLSGGFVWSVLGTVPPMLFQLTPGSLALDSWTAPTGTAGFNEYAADQAAQYVTTFENPAHVLRLLPPPTTSTTTVTTTTATTTTSTTQTTTTTSSTSTTVTTSTTATTSTTVCRRKKRRCR